MMIVKVSLSNLKKNPRLNRSAYIHFQDKWVTLVILSTITRVVLKVFKVLNILLLLLLDNI